MKIPAMANQTSVLIRTVLAGRLSGVVARVSDLGLRDREFDSRPVHCRVA